MNKKMIVPLVVIVAILIITTVVISKNKKVSASKNINSSSLQGSAIGFANSNAPLKEFSMTSYTDVVNGQYHPNFSLKDITVNKGDRVRIKITEISGNHDFKIDEFGVYTVTDLNKEAVVEFVADKQGSFVYYCTKPGHRQNGQWGTLKVI